MRHIEYTYTEGMGDEELAERLRAREMGVLSLVDGDDAFGFPVAHHYDGERLYLRLCERPGRGKSDVVDATDRASFVVTGGETSEEAWSVVVRGSLTPVDDVTDEALNEWFAPLRLFDEPVEDVVPVVYRMEIRDVGGRRSCGPVNLG